ncbi:MAG TPA: glycoside hydrolase family 3 C-terminal domain-containing protein [Candidatus Blautia faecigallinarum]|uniref:Glycoside hydrolase family 3 C-terminal domain-containing protein n=1 Tax=Candidatus Blautia faecigallinarum TaxID=2838488 RepID=A0A9D2DUN3_9FIRM|nr:glycoside hydrolase family 3 C-terminal domain-containing protein [Candidatus Blautia faecigallinarum]
MKKRTRTFSGTTVKSESEREQKNRRIARRAAEEGIVVLKNEGVLPLDVHTPVALFGAGACCTVKGGTGSGDVCERKSVSVYEGMENAGFSITSREWLSDYENTWEQARKDWKDQILKEANAPGAPGFFDVYSSHPFAMPVGREISSEDIKDARTAVYVISRIAGEGKDRTSAAGDYDLSEKEEKDLRTLGDLCESIIVLINAGTQIDLGVILSIPQIKGIVNISQPGMEGGNAVGDILSGKSVPSGKLTDTWAKNYRDFPNADSFAYMKGGDLDEKYTEGIYVGYRWFEAFDRAVEFPFGFGLSYTSFEIATEQVSVNENELQIHVTVKNTGSRYSGKEVVQVYVSAPQSLDKEVKKLCAFAKTGLLAPGEKESLRLSCKMKDLAYFDEKSAEWRLDEGDYYVLVGNDSVHVSVEAVLHCDKAVSLERTAHICPLCVDLEEIKPDTEHICAVRRQYAAQAEEKGLKAMGFTPAQETKKTFPKNRYRILAESVTEKLSADQLKAMAVGEISRGHDVALGAAGIMVPGAAGETSGCLEKEYGIPGISMADGPAGIRVMKEYQADEEKGQIFTQGLLGALENGLFVEDSENVHPGTVTYYQYCTAFPVGVMLAQTWNTEVLKDVGRAVGTEMQELGVSWWLAPGMNIHRNPLCGRNFEYYSEDPLVSGKMAASITKGVQEIPGVGTTIKHFACNNLETHRMSSNSILSERTLREIYLRGFEIAVKEAQPMAVMTSYNLINGVHAANCRDLCTVALREEWGFQGFVMTDWTTTGKNGGSKAWKCAQAGNDLIMPGEDGDYTSISQALEMGELKEEDLRECVCRLLTVIFQTNAFEECEAYSKQFE